MIRRKGEADLGGLALALIMMSSMLLFLSTFSSTESSKKPYEPNSYFIEGVQAKTSGMERSANPYPEQKYEDVIDISSEHMRQKYFPDTPPKMIRKYEETGYRRNEWFMGYDAKGG